VALSVSVALRVNLSHADVTAIDPPPRHIDARRVSLQRAAHKQQRTETKCA